ncbi:hypothetical protein ACLMJK_001294 [Lecanora helva]
MSSRKRKIIDTPGSQGISSKRAKLLSSLWQSEDVEHNRDLLYLNSPTYQDPKNISNSTKNRQEATQCLVPWDNNLLSGGYSHPNLRNAKVGRPDKETAKDRRTVLPQEEINPNRQRRLKQYQDFSRECTSGDSADSAVKSKTQKGQEHSKTTSHVSINDLLAQSSQSKSEIRAYPLSTGKCDFPRVTVQVSLRRSIDRDLYIKYWSSSSAQKRSSADSQTQLSGSTRSHGEFAISSGSVSSQDIIVPDSQPLPGSSSYIPTSSTSDGSSASQSALKSTPSQSGRWSSLGLLGDESHISKQNLDSPILNTRSHCNSVQGTVSVIKEGLEDTPSSSISSGHPPQLTRWASFPSSSHSIHQSQQGVDTSRPTENRHYSVNFPLQSRSISLDSLDPSRSPVLEVPDSFDRPPEENSTVESTAHSQNLSPSRQATHAHTLKQREQAGASREAEHKHFPQVLPKRKGEDVLKSPSVGGGNISSPTARETNRHRLTAPEESLVSEGFTKARHPFQVTTADEPALSSRGSISQDRGTNRSQLLAEKIVDVDYWGSLSVNPDKPNLLDTIDSLELPQPLASTATNMSDASSNQQPLSAGPQSPLGTTEKLKKMREESAAKKRAAGRETVRGRENRSPRDQTAEVTPFSMQSSQGFPREQRQLSLPAGSYGWPQPPMTLASHALPVPNWTGSLQSQFQPPVGRAQMVSDRSISQPTSPLSRGPSSSAFTPVNAPQPLALAPLTLGSNYGPRLAPSAIQSQPPVQIHSPGLLQSRASTGTPDVIPSKLPYHAQEEPERLEVQPAVISTELPPPMRSSQSMPHTPATPSRLATHIEASVPETSTLKVINLGRQEFIVPLCMQKRIKRQYIDTIEYYPRTTRDNLMEKTIGEQCVTKLNELLCRLANVSTHIGLEGGGPSSQESVRSEQEATYAELSSEKFRFLGHLFTALKGWTVHIVVVARAGPLHDILELFLKGKKVHYNRPSTYTKSNLGEDGGKLQVTLIASAEAQPVHFTRKADLIIAFDETFRATDQTVADLRQNPMGLEPSSAPTRVIRLVVYGSVEHLDLCLPRTLNPIERIRKLVHCVWHTQNIVGELSERERNTEQSARSVASFASPLHSFTWPLPPIRSIENIPLMDSDSSLSDYTSDASEKILGSSELRKYWPDRTSASVGPPSTQVSSSGKRPFDLEYGDSLDTQAKKMKMAKDARAGKPIEEPRTIQNLEKKLKEMQDNERDLILKQTRQQELITSLQNGAEVRQGAYEDLHDQWRELHVDKVELTAEVAKLKKLIEKGRIERLSLQGERSTLNKTIDDLRTQLLSHPDPAVRENGEKDAQIRTLSTELAAVNKKLDSTSGQLNYIKEQYQEASLRAATYSTESEAFQRTIERLEPQLAHERARRKHERENDPRKPLFAEITNLRTELSFAHRLIARKEEEITALKRGRTQGMQTRGSSAQPKSPRGGAGSRGASPALSTGAAGNASAGGAPGGGVKGPSGLNRPLKVDD